MNSVLAQTYTNWDLWIAVNGHGDDGGSVAETARRIAQRDSRIHVVVQGSIAGKVASLNDVVRRTGGEWICLLDVDDVWMPGKLQRQVSALAGEAKHAAVIGTRCRYFGTMHHEPAIRCGECRFADLLQENQVINSSAMIHRSWATWRDLPVEDYDMWLRITLVGGTIYNIPEVLVGHRIHPGSAFNTKNISPVPLRDMYRILGDVFFATGAAYR